MQPRQTDALGIGIGRGSSNKEDKSGRYSLPRDAPPAHVARAALLAPHGSRDGPGEGEHGGGAGLLAAG